MNNNIRNIFSILSRILNKSNFNKFLIIFIVGFVSRTLVYYFYNVNVYLDFLNVVSVSYYICMSAFIISVHEFVNCFDFNIIPFKFSILKEGIKRIYINGLDNKLFMDSNVNEVKPSGEIGISDKGGYSPRPVKPSPLSNPPVTPSNLDEMKPTREINFHDKKKSSLRPVNSSPNHPMNSSSNHPTRSQKTSAFQERDRDITKFKEEFKKFYTVYKEFIKLSNYELESLSIKMAIEDEKGGDG